MSARRIGNYQITEYVGSGGFGSVFKAEDVNTPGRVVAVKELHRKHTRNQVIKQRFFQEAVAMARLDHPNLPRLFTFGEDNGSYYLVMEFITGRLLSDEIHERGPLRPDQAVAVLTQIVDALSYAHRNGIIHRDLKPDNIILLGDGGSFRVKVLDFGIARMIGGESLTLTGEGFGTPSYMSPERMTGAGGDDPRMDLYSAGIMLVEMLTGKAPFESIASDPSQYWIEMRQLHERQALPPLAPLGVSPNVERIATRASAKRLEDRYQSADEMLADLKQLPLSGDEPTAVLPSSRLALTTSPGGAEVYVDDVLRGNSESVRGTLQVDELAVGLHTVRVLKEGYNEYRINVALEEGRLTDLRVALAARATVAMPQGANTAAGGFDTVRLGGADETRTAMLTVESLPAGTALFIGSQPAGHAGEDGRVTLKLSPGEYEIRAATPTGAVGMRVITVTDQDISGLKTMTLPLAQATAMNAATSAIVPASKKRKQAAVAATVAIFAALGSATYFALRGPDRPRPQVESAASTAAALPAQPGQPSKSPDTSQVNDDKKQADDARRRTEREAAAVEAQSKAAEAKIANKNEKKDTSPKEGSPPVPAPPVAAVTPQEAERPATAGGACLMVMVTDVDGQAVPRIRVAVVDQPDAASSRALNGRTGEKGRWVNCGLTAGHKVRVAVFGRRGAMLGTQQTTLSVGRNVVEIKLNKKTDDGASLPVPPNRKRPYFQRP